MLEHWGDFMVATAGAAAALAGLIIVAMSVNIQRIIELPGMTSRAAVTIATLILIVISVSAALIPGQPLAILGLEILLFAAGTMVMLIRSAVAMLRAAGPDYRTVTVVKVVLTAIQILLFAIGAVLLVTGAEEGMYWVAAGVLAVFIGSVANAWVLLVEILR